MIVGDEKEVCYGFVIRGQARPTILPSLRHTTVQPLPRLQCHARRLRGMRCIRPTVRAVRSAYRTNFYAGN